MPLAPMNIDERYQYLRRMQARYRQADRATKGVLLDEMVAHTGLHRKSLIRRLNGKIVRHQRRREREAQYGPAVDAALLLIWEALDYVCPTRLTPRLLPTARALAAHGALDVPPSLEQDLAAISISTVRRHLPPLPPVERQRRRPAAPNRHQQQIPAYRIPRDIDAPGHLELDLVHHCGAATRGEYVCTLQCIDVATSWCGRRAVLGRGSVVMADALHYLFQTWPCRIREVHPDNGSEFLNTQLLSFVHDHYPHITWSRSRPGKPNDNRLVEQKNDTGIRRYLGDRRFDTVTQTRYLNRIYERLDRYTNYFLPVMHQIDKQWVPAADGHGGYLRRKHDEAQPPLDRLLALQPADWAADQADKLRTARDALNPLQERRTLQQKLDHLFSYPNATPGQPENVFEILSHPELFPAAQAALQADETDDLIASLSADDSLPATTASNKEKEDSGIR